MGSASRYCSLNGEIIPESDAYLSPFDRGFIYGDAVYEVIPVFAGQPFGFEQHLTRLRRSLGAARIVLDEDKDVRRVAESLLSANGEWMRSQAVCRLGMWISRGVQELDWRIHPQMQPTIFMFCWPVDAEGITRRRREGLRLVVATRRRVPTEVLDARIKMTSRFSMALAEVEVQDRGDMPLLLDWDGRITECSSANFFVVQDDVVKTPPPEQALQGVTRDFAISYARDAGYQVVEQDLRDYDCVTATEAFITSSTAGIVPVREVVPYGGPLDVPGPVTSALMARLDQETGFDATL